MSDEEQEETDREWLERWEREGIPEDERAKLVAFAAQCAPMAATVNRRFANIAAQYAPIAAKLNEEMSFR